jgi:hypothetical protein
MKTIKPGLSKVLAALVWLATIVAGLLDVYVSQFIVIWFYTTFFIKDPTQVHSMDVAAFNTIRITGVLIAAVIFVIFIIATSEYHAKHFAQPSSWRLWGKTIAVELLIIILAYILGPVTW